MDKKDRMELCRAAVEELLAEQEILKPQEIKI